jgi:hypothetical protein
MNQVTEKKNNVPQKFNLEEHADQGNEFVTARDTKLPILKILYSNSPVLDESDGKFNDKARQGDIYNEITGNLYKGKDGVLVVPCLYVNTFNEWKDRGDSPGRPIAIHRDYDIMRKTSRSDDGKDRLENGNYVEDTGNHFVYILDKNYAPVETALITMKSTQKKKSKLWNSMLQSRRVKGSNGFYCPPSWSQVYKLTTTKESNSQNSWYGWVVEFEKMLSPDSNLNTLEVLNAFYKSAKTSDIFGTVAFEEENKKTSTESVQQPAQQADANSDVPF